LARRAIGSAVSALLAVTAAEVATATVAAAATVDPSQGAVEGRATPRPGRAIDVDRPGRSPSLATQAATLELGGSARAGTASMRVRALDVRGWFELTLGVPGADGRRPWSSSALPLHAGRNVFELEGRDAAGRRSSRFVAVSRLSGVAAGSNLQLVAWRGRTLPAEIRHGHAFIEGDIDLAAGAQAHAQAGAQAHAQAGAHGDAGLGIADPASFWPKVKGVAQIPYTITSGNANVVPAIDQVNAQLAGILQFVPHGSEPDYVDFDLDPNDQSGTGEAQVGRIGGRQVIAGSILSNEPTLIHEMGHTIGLWHEQSRPDRDAWVTLAEDNVIKTLAPNFDIQRSNVQAFGLYDVQSVMHYIPFTFTKNGEPTLETVPPGIRVSDLGILSAGDVDAIGRLYGHAPSQVTITSNPPGLAVTVDGAQVTTPHAFAFAIGSQHTVSIGSDAQLPGDGDAYVFGRWNDGGAAAHTITIAPGNGLEASPAGLPAVTLYQADFVQMVAYAPAIYPAGAGTLAATPPPLALPGATGKWYPARQPVTLTANGASGEALYRLYTADGGEAENPKITRYPGWVLAYFTSQPQVSITTAPAVHWTWVDTVFHETPTNFSADYAADGDWSIGSTHLLDIQVDPQQPYSWSIRYPWESWSDGGARAHQVVSPGAPASYTATLGTQYNYAAWAAPLCGGGVTANPATPDNFYDAGATVGFDEMPVTGWTFSGWQADLAGLVHPQNLLMDDERLVVAGYDTSSTPLALTGLAPPYAVAGSKSLALTITGSGFTNATRVFIDGNYVAPSKVTATSVKVKVPAASLKSVGGSEIDVDNVPSGNWPCSNYAIRTLPVLAKGELPLVSPSPAKVAFGKQKTGKASTPQAITLTNAGSALAGLYVPVMTGPNASDFSISNDCGGSLGAGAQCSVAVTFKPGAKGLRSATLLLLDSAFDSPQAVPLSGTGS
jgi:hypothetical protein